MASLSVEEKLEFLLHILATCDEFKPNYGKTAKRLGINTTSNAQRRFKGIVEADKTFILQSNSGKNAETKVVEIGSKIKTKVEQPVSAPETPRSGRGSI